MIVEGPIAELGGRITKATNFIVRSIIASVFEVRRGTIEEPGEAIFSVNAEGKVDALNLFGTIDDVTASRTWGTPYTNNKKVPIFVSVGITQGGGVDIYAQFTVNGKLMPLLAAYAPSPGYRSVMHCMVPAGGTYRLDTVGSDTLNAWLEQY